jgi:peptidylprolyl isomerase
MNPFNKYEAIGIFLSIAVMALALSVVRFKSDLFALGTSDDNAPELGAVVAVSQDAEGNQMKEDDELESALRDGFSASGELVELVIDDVRIGTGPEVKKDDVVSVHYIGTTQDGVRFDSSYDRGETFSFKVGAGVVIRGWDEGLLGMKVGGQRILVIPGSMAYGNMQVGVIPPNSPLVFAVELLEIK